MIRWLGFFLVTNGTALFGFFLASLVKTQLQIYHKLLLCLELMRTEIEFHLTPIGEIAGQLSARCKKPLNGIFGEFHQKMRGQPGIPAGTQMRRVLRNHRNHLPLPAIEVLSDLFDSLGKQDLCSQIRAIEYGESRLKHVIQQIEQEKKDRCRTYRTVGICAGLALAIILI